MHKRNLLALIMTAVMGISMLTGCAGTSDGGAAPAAAPAAESQEGAEVQEAAPEAGDTVELAYWTLSSRQNNVDKLVESFNNAHDDIHVTVSYYDTDGMKDACKIGAQAGTLPDMWFNWGGSLGGYYPANGCTYDLTQYAADHGWADKFNSGVLELCNLEGQLCGYPCAYVTVGMYYKKSVFEDLGLEVPSTFEEFEALCAAIKESGITPISTAGLYGWHVMRLIEQFVEYYAGAEEHDRLNTFDESWDSEAVIKALAKYQEFCEKGYFPVGFVTADPNDTLMGLANGSCAMDIQVSSYDDTIIGKELDPHDYGWFPFPNGTQRMSAFAEMVQLNANLSDEKLEAAMTFLNETQTQENSDAGLIKLIPVNGVKLDEDVRPNMGSMLAWGAEHGGFTITDQAFPTSVADVLFDGEAAIANGTESPEEVAANVQEAISKYIKGE